MEDIVLVKVDNDGATFGDGRKVFDNDIISAVKKHMRWYDKLSAEKVAKATIIIQTLFYSDCYSGGDWKFTFR